MFFYDIAIVPSTYTHVATLGESLHLMVDPIARSPDSTRGGVLQRQRMPGSETD